MKRLCHIRFGKLRTGVGSCADQSQKHGVIGYRVEVQWLAQCHVEASGVLDSFTLGEAVGIIRCGESAKSEGIEGVSCVHVQVTKIGFSLCISVQLATDEISCHGE